jgi:hypothetical protein
VFESLISEQCLGASRHREIGVERVFDDTAKDATFRQIMLLPTDVSDKFNQRALNIHRIDAATSADGHFDVLKS